MSDDLSHLTLLDDKENMTKYNVKYKKKRNTNVIWMQSPHYLSSFSAVQENQMAAHRGCFYYSAASCLVPVRALLLVVDSV